MISIPSEYGHRMMQNGDAERCLTCGAVYELIETPGHASTSHAYVTITGDVPDECTGDTNMVHGYPGERFCWDHDGEPCEHTEHGCNCLLCD